MAYTEINARRLLAQKLFEAQERTSDHGERWIDQPPETKRFYERDIEALFTFTDPDTKRAVRHLLNADCT